MRVNEILNNYEQCLADIEVILNGETRLAPTLCVTDTRLVVRNNCQLVLLDDYQIGIRL